MRTVIELIVGTFLLVIVLFLVFDNRNYADINDKLKEENAQYKTDVRQAREERNLAQDKEREWFNNYIDLGIKCGANE